MYNILIPIIFIFGGSFSIFYLRPKILSKTLEIQYMKTKTIKELFDSFQMMKDSGLGENYREFVELKGIISSKGVITPFSEKNVAYCESKIYRVNEIIDEYIDDDGNRKQKVKKDETLLSEEKSSNYFEMKDSSSENTIVLEANAYGCTLDIPKTFSRMENINNLSKYSYFNRGDFFNSYHNSNVRTLGYRMEEKTIEMDQSLYVIGEAYYVGEKLHIGTPSEENKPFLISTRSEEDLVKGYKNDAKVYLILGIISIVLGFGLIIYRILSN